MRIAPVKYDTLAGSIVTSLRELIASGELKGGQRLVEAQIASQLGVSRGPVREAFKQLQVEGLLRDIPRRGTYVALLDAEDARDLLNLRAGLEARAARLFIERSDPAAFDTLEAALDRLDEACQGKEESQISAADYEFHEAVQRGSGSQRLLEVFIRYSTELRVLLRSDTDRVFQPLGDVVRDHRILRDALRAGDAIAAETAFRTHVEDTRDRLDRRLQAGATLGDNKVLV